MSTLTAGSQGKCLLIMPRPALSLYRHLPIAYKHRCLLLAVHGNTDNEIIEFIPKIRAGFTGVVVARTQLENIPVLQQSYMPKVVVLNTLGSDELDCTVAEAQALGASAVLLFVELGQSSSMQQLQRLRSLVTQAQKSKLSVIVQMVFKQAISGKARAVMLAYALRLSMDYKVDYLLIDQPKDINDISFLFQIADEGSLLVASRVLQSREMKRLLAAGAAGMIVELSDTLGDTDPGQIAFGLGEAVFGPGSYQP